MGPKNARLAKLERLMEKIFLHDEDDPDDAEESGEPEQGDGGVTMDDDTENEDEEVGAADTPQFDNSDTVQPVYPQPGQRAPGPGSGPPKVKSLTYKNRLKFFHPAGHQHQVLCDLGFTGVIDNKVVWSFGDTLMGTPKKCQIVAQDSIGIGSMRRPMTVLNTALGPQNKNIRNWIPCTEEERRDGGHSNYSFGGTNIIEYAPNKGLVYYLKIKRGGKPKGLYGAGVATVKMTDNSIPKAHRNGDFMWGKNEPKWGDVGIAYNAQDEHVYVYGHGPNGDKEISGRCFLCKAPAARATDIASYLYWDNAQQTWHTRRFTRDGAPGTIKIRKNMAVMGWRAVNQANPFWSNYYNRWMMLHGDCFGYSHIKVSTALRLEGPWKEHGVVAKTDPPNKQKGFRYCQTGHPEFDASGKTVLATWTRGNRIFGVNIEWE